MPTATASLVSSGVAFPTLLSPRLVSSHRRWSHNFCDAVGISRRMLGKTFVVRDALGGKPSEISSVRFPSPAIVLCHDLDLGGQRSSP